MWSFPSSMMPHSLAKEEATRESGSLFACLFVCFVYLLSAVNIRTLIPALLHLMIASGTSALIGSFIPKMAIKVRFDSRKFVLYFLSADSISLKAMERVRSPGKFLKLLSKIKQTIKIFFHH
jgi:hypothetical protein